MIGLFVLFAYAGRKVSRDLRENMEVQVLLHNNLSKAQQAGVAAYLKAHEAVKLDEEVRGEAVRFVSKAEAAEKIMAETGEDFLSTLGENPLRDAFIIKLREEWHSEERLEALTAELEAQVHVVEVFYTRNVVAEINRNLRTVALVVLGFVVIFLVTVVLLINSAIRLAMFSQRFLIRNMQLVGATSFFIQKPFFRRAAWQGVSSGAVAGILLWVVVQAAVSLSPALATYLRWWELLLLTLLLMLLGVAVAVMSTWRATHKYLRMKLDELY